MQLEYRTLDEFPGYKFGSDGTVLSYWNKGGLLRDEPRTLRTDTVKGGYLRVTLRVGKRRYDRRFVASLVLEAFVGPAPEGHVACHWDGIPTNNAIENLRWDTRSANESDKKRHGTYQEGEWNPAAKLTAEIVRKIREAHALGQSIRSLSAEHRISRPVVAKIIARKLWRCVA